VFFFHRLIKPVSFLPILALHFKDHPDRQARLVPSDYKVRRVPRDLEDCQDVQALREPPAILVLKVRRDLLGLLVPAGSEAPKDSTDHRALRETREHPAQKVLRAPLGYMI